MATPITTVSGIGAQTAEILVENGFESAEALAAAKEEDLLKISGFGPSRAKKLIESAQTLLPEDVPVSEDPSKVEIEEKREVETVVEQKEEKVAKSSEPKICTQKLSKKSKKKKAAKAKKKKKKSSRKKK